MPVAHRPLIAGAVVAALAVAPATALAGWSAPLLLSPREGATVGYPQISVGASGDRMALWAQSSLPSTGTSYRVQGSEAQAGGFWTPLGAPVSATGTVLDFFTPALDVAPNGAVAAAWMQSANRDLHVASRPYGHGTLFGPAKSLTMGSGGCSNNPPIADNEVVGPAVTLGNSGGHVGWMSPCGNTTNGRWMKFAPVSADGAIADSGTVAGRGAANGGAGTNSGPQLLRDDVTGFGRMVFLAPTPLNGVVEYTLNGNAVVGSPTPVEGTTPTRNLGTTRNAQLANGDLITIWRNTQVSPPAVEIRVGSDAPVRLSSVTQDAIAPEVAAGRDGTIVAGWKVSGGPANGSWWAAVRHPETKQWSAPHQLSESDAGNPLSLGISDVGVAYAVWHRDTGALITVEGSIMDPYDPTRSPGDPWRFQPVAETIVDGGVQGAVDGSIGDATDPRLAVAPDGQAWIVYRAVTEAQPALRFAAAVSHSPISRAGGPITPVPTATAAPPPVSNPAAPPAARDTTAPRITTLTPSRQRFAVGSKEGKVVADRGDRTVGVKKNRSPLRVGTVLRWTQTEAGKTSVTIEHVGCWTLTSAGDPPKDAPVCKRRKLDGVVYTKTVTAKVGANSLKFLGNKGLKSGKELRLNGRYRVTVVGIDAAGNAGASKSAMLEVDGAVARR